MRVCDRFFCSSEAAVYGELVSVIKQQWPRANVYAYGSCQTELCLPSGDMDLVICLPNVMMNDTSFAAGPGPLEGRNTLYKTWQESLEQVLRLSSWVKQDSIKIIKHAPVQIIKVRSSGKPHHDIPIDLDISFEAGNHTGRNTIKLIKSLCARFSALKPLVLVLKQHLKEQKLGEAYTGGLNSYGLTLLVACFLKHYKHISTMHTTSPGPTTPNWKRHRNAMQHPSLGDLLLLFLKFHSDTLSFDPCKIGISLERGYFNRTVALNIQSRHPIPPNNIANPNIAARRRSLKGNVLSPATTPTGPANVTQRVSQSEASKGTTTSSASASAKTTQHRFDLVYIEDPLKEGHNVVKNCFRIHNIQRAWHDAASVLSKAMLGTPAPSKTTSSLLGHIIGILNTSKEG